MTGGGIVKAAVLRVPVVLTRGAGRGAPWHGWPDLGDDTVRERLDVTAATEDAARRALAELVAGALCRAAAQPILVIGGAADYAGCVHVINPEPYGWVVHAVRDGRHCGSWHSDHGPEKLLEQVLDHVGGQPAVVRL